MINSSTLLAVRFGGQYSWQITSGETGSGTILDVHDWKYGPHDDAYVSGVEPTNRAHPGFVSARVLESADGSSIAAFVEMQTVEDRQRLEQLASVRDALDHLPGTVNVVLRLYHEVATYPA
jgi:hypothetical protein